MSTRATGTRLGDELFLPYRPAPEAPALHWPGDARLAVWVVPNIEWFALDRPVPGGSGRVLDVRPWSVREYGNQVGIWRIAEILDRLGIRATAALNANVCAAYPAIIQAGIRSGWEWMGHGLTNTDHVTELDEDAERAMIERTIDEIARATGHRPRGWLTPHFEQHPGSTRLLRERGITYVADWMIDERPFPLRAGAGWMLCLPYSVELNDKPCYETWGLTPAEFRDHLCRSFDVLLREGERSATVLAIGVHTYISGYPARAAALEEALRYMRGHEGVWWATGAEICDAYLAQDPLPGPD